ERGRIGQGGKLRSGSPPLRGHEPHRNGPRNRGCEQRSGQRRRPSRRSRERGRAGVRPLHRRARLLRPGPGSTRMSGGVGDATSGGAGSNGSGQVPVRMWTDGACKGNPGRGGWGVLMKYGTHSKEIFGGERETTNNRMELTAVIRGLQALTR